MEAEICYFLEVARLGAGQQEDVRTSFAKLLQKPHRDEDDFGAASYFIQRGEAKFAESLFNEFVLVAPGLPGLWFALAETARGLHD